MTSRDAGKRIAVLIDLRYAGNIKAAAEDMDVNYMALYRAVTGRTGVSADMLVRCASHFGYSVEDLMARGAPRRRA